MVDRAIIEMWRRDGWSIRVIVRGLGRSSGAVCDEIRWHGDTRGYLVVTAEAGVGASSRRSGRKPRLVPDGPLLPRSSVYCGLAKRPHAASADIRTAQAAPSRRAWRACQFRGRNWSSLRAGCPAIRPSTSASQTCGSTSVSFAVTINEYIAAARFPPRPEPANNHDFLPSAIPRRARSAAFFDRQSCGFRHKPPTYSNLMPPIVLR